MVEPSPSAAARVIPLRGGWTIVVHLRASSLGPAACLWDPEVQREKARSAPAQFEGMRIASLLAERTEEGCSLVQSRERGRLVLPSRAWVLRPCFTALDVELARAGARPHRLQAVVSWCRSLDSRSGPVLEGRPPGNGSAGRLFQVEDIGCSAPLQVNQSGSVNTRLAATVAHRLRENPAS